MAQVCCAVPPRAHLLAATLLGIVLGVLLGVSL